MAKQKSSGWLDQFVSKVPKTFGKGVAASDVAQSKPGPVFLGNPYAKEMAKRQTYISPYDAEQKASPAMQQVFAEKADTQAKKKRIRDFLEEQQDVLGKAEMLSLIPTPFTEVVGGAAGITNAAISAALAGQDFSEGNYVSALGNFGAGALGAGAGSIGIRGGLNNVIDDLLPTKGPKNFMSGKSMSSTPGILGTLKPLEPYQEIGMHAIGDLDYVSDRELKEAYQEALDKFQLTNYRPNVDPFLDHDVEKALAMNVRMKFADRLPKFTDNKYTAAVHGEDPFFFDARGPYSERFFNQQGYDLSKLNPQDRTLMDAYQHGYDSYFNKRPNVHKLPTTLKDYFGELSDQFNTAVQKNKINKDITLNRSVGNYTIDLLDPVTNKSIGKGLRDELQVGDVYKEPGFLSTSLPHYIYGGGKYTDKIIVPGGGVQSYAFPNATSYGQFMGEQEVILPKGLIRRVEDVPEPGQVITSILNPYKDGGWLEKYQDGGLTDKYLGVKTNSKGKYVPPTNSGWTTSAAATAYNKASMQTPTDIDANAMQALEQVTSYPQRKVTEWISGKNQYPSQAMGIQNPYGAFAIDAIADPVNLVGAGLLGKAAKASGKLSKASKIAKAASKGEDAIKLTRAAVPNPLALLDQFTPRLDPIKAMGVEMDIMDLSPLNLIPGYGKKLSGKNQTFRKFGNSLDDVIQRQALSPAGGSDVFRIGKDQIVSEGNWAARNQPSENYPGVFEATFDMNNPNANLSALQIPDRNGVLMVDRLGRRLPEIPLTEPGMSFNRRLPFSTRYVPIDKTKLMNNQFQLATQLPHLQSLVEKYGLAVGGAGAYGYFRGGEEGAKEKIDFINQYTVDPVLDVFKGGIDKATELLPKKKNGGWLDKYNDGGPVQPNYNDASVSMSDDFVGDGYSNVGRNYSPAWGGQFKNGGDLSFVSNPKLRNMLEGYKPGFLETANDYRLPEGYMAGSIYPSTEVSTSIGGEDGEPAYLIPSFKYGQPLQDPVQEFNMTGQYLGGPFKTWQDAEKFQEIRHQYVEKGQPLPSPIATSNMAMGGSLPGSVGFTYARTIGPPAPSNGKYAKKTKASAQNGTEMRYYQEGLDFKPKTISKNGSELKKLDQLTNFTNYNPTKPSGWLEKYQ